MRSVPTKMRLGFKDAKSLGQVVRYIIVGGWNTVFGYGAFAGLTYLLTDRIPYAYMVASILANILAITMAFVGHKLITFRTRGNYLREYLRFYVVYGASAAVGLVLLPICVAALGLVVSNKAALPYIAAALLLPVGVVLGFVGHKRFSFRGSMTEPSSGGRPT